MTGIHRPLCSFLSSAVEVGTRYEEHVQEYLQRTLRAALERSGGANDRGIDLTGQLGHNLGLIVQCKHFQAAVTPAVVRELQGTLHYYAHCAMSAVHPNGTNVLALLACSGGVKEGSLEALRQSSLPLGILVLKMHHQHASSFMLNRVARSLLPNVIIRAVYEHDSHDNCLHKFIDLSYPEINKSNPLPS
jgi:hypothetical protein